VAHKRGLFEAFLKVATIKKTPVLKREELYQGLIEPGWGAGLLNPAQEGERNILYMTPLTLKSFLYVFLHSTSIISGLRNRFGRRTLSISISYSWRVRVMSVLPTTLSAKRSFTSFTVPKRLFFLLGVAARQPSRDPFSGGKRVAKQPFLRLK
jgi:hypothetical protein